MSYIPEKYIHEIFLEYLYAMTSQDKAGVEENKNEYFTWETPTLTNLSEKEYQEKLGDNSPGDKEEGNTSGDKE